MREIFLMQVQHILGGRMKWLVILSLILPVLLTAALLVTGGAEKIEREIEQELTQGRDRALLAAGVFPESAQRVRWEGEDEELLKGFLILTERGPILNGALHPGGQVTIINRGRYLVRGHELWIDKERKKGRKGRYRLHQYSLRDGPVDVESQPEVLTAGLEAIYLFLLYPQVICLLLALFYGTSVLGNELDGKTLTYLFTRPLARWKVVVGKYLGIVAVLVPAAGLSMLGSGVILDVSGGHIAILLMGMVGAVLAYTAVFLFIGFLIPRRAMVVGLLYGIVFEFVLSFAPALVNEATVTYYLRSLVAGLLEIPIPRELARIVGGATVPGALLGLGVITVTSLALASVLAARREYVITDEA